MRQYQYIGPDALRRGTSPTRQHIKGKADILLWIQRTQQKPDAAGEVIATFIVDTQGYLWIADRHSEHVACASGGPVLSAGEMTFRVTKNDVEVSAVTNQSTGFCPESESWPSVAAVLKRTDITYPDNFTTSFHFRRCTNCGSINIVKEDWFICAVCDTELSVSWNFK